MAHAAGRDYGRVVNAGGKRHGEKHMQWARGMQGVHEDRYGGEGEHEARWCTWVCVSPSSSPSESGAPTKQCYGTGAGMGAVEPCSA